MKVEQYYANKTPLSDQRQPSETASPLNIEQLEITRNSVYVLCAYVDTAQVIRWVNQAYERLCGILAENSVGRLALDVLREHIGDEYADSVRPYMEQALTGSEITFETSHYYGGKQNDLFETYIPDRTANGTIRGFVAVTVNQTEQRRIEREVKANEQQFRTLSEMLPSTIWTATPQGEVEFLSNQFQEDTGLPPEEGTGSGWTEIIHPEDLPDMIKCRDTAVSSGTLFETQCRVRLREGAYRWYLLRALPEHDQNGNLIRWFGIATDIDSQVLAERAARESGRRYRILFDDNPLPMFTYDTQTLRILSANRVAVSRYGFSKEEFLQMRLSEVLPQDDIPAQLAVMKDPPEGSPIGPIRHRRKDATVFWVEVTCHSLSGEAPSLRIIVVKDVSEQVRLNAELVRRANCDSLTGLPNGSLLVDRFRMAVERAKRTGQRIAVLAIDFDRFKQVNNTFGHQIGDELLKLSTLRLLSTLRVSDMLARVGGDEFIVLAESLDSTEAGSRIAARLIAALNAPITIHNMELHSSISIGIAFYPDDGNEFEEIHRRADYSLHKVKRIGGTNWRIYSHKAARGIKEAMEIECSLRKAVSEGRLELHYQTIVNPRRNIVKMEALVRFPHPTLGLLPPARFIPIAEECGLVKPIGLWVLREACRQIRQWQSDGLNVVPIAVNVSAAQFRREGICDVVRGVLGEFDIDPELLELELTESLLMENTEQSWKQLRQLKEMGIHVAIDDFGTGYSSLSYLHLLPLHRLKIDKSFVQNMTSDDSRSIVRAIIELGRNLGLTVIAEGVETEAQYEELVKMNCDLMQGFLFSKPGPAAKFASFLMPEHAKTSKRPE